MRALILAAVVGLGGCSAVLGDANAGIAPLERGRGRVAAQGAKYAGWIASAPLVLATVPFAALAWATPWIDLADFADIVTAPALGLGYVFEGLIGLPALLIPGS